MEAYILLFVTNLGYTASKYSHIKNLANERVVLSVFSDLMASCFWLTSTYLGIKGLLDGNVGMIITLILSNATANLLVQKKTILKHIENRYGPTDKPVT